MNSMLLDLTRNRNAKSHGHNPRIVGLLKMVGVPDRMLYTRRLPQNKSFWIRGINHLEVLERARGLYRRELACVHPDKAGGDLEQTIQLNHAWSEIKQRFKMHGHELW